MYKTLLLFFFSLLSFTGFGQQTVNKKSFSIDLGVQPILFKDLNFSPLNYQGTGGFITLKYEKQTAKKNLIYATLNYTGATITYETVDFTSAQNVQSYLRLGYLIPQNRQAEKTQYLLGGSIQSMVDYVDYESFEALTYFNLHTVNLDAQIRHQIDGKSQLIGIVTLPVTGILVRPPHTGWDHTINTTSPLKLIYDGDFSTIGQFVSISTQLIYRYQLSPKTNIQIKTAYHYQQTNKTAPISIHNFQMGVGLNYNLGK